MTRSSSPKLTHCRHTRVDSDPRRAACAEIRISEDGALHEHVVRLRVCARCLERVQALVASEVVP